MVTKKPKAWYKEPNILYKEHDSEQPFKSAPALSPEQQTHTHTQQFRETFRRVQKTKTFSHKLVSIYCLFDKSSSVQDRFGQDLAKHNQLLPWLDWICDWSTASSKAKHLN